MGETRPEIEQKYQLGILYLTFTAFAVKTCNIIS